MDSEEDADKAVALMNKKEINGRQINVEVAKPQDETTKKPRAEGEDAPKKPRKPRVPKEENSDEGRPAPKPRVKRAPAAEGEVDEDGKPKKRSGRGKPTGLPRRSTEPREESKTTLFVANLPFSLNDEEFAKVLTDKQLKLKSAHVVSKKNGKSKGYGFVEFDTQEDQQKALAALHKHTVDARELSVKVALTELKTDSNDDENKPQEKKAPAPAEKKSSPAPAEKKASPAPVKASPSPAEKKVVEKKSETPEKKPVAEKKTPVADKKTATPEKKEEKK